MNLIFGLFVIFIMVSLVSVDIIKDKNFNDNLDSPIEFEDIRKDLENDSVNSCDYDCSDSNKSTYNKRK